MTTWNSVIDRVKGEIAWRLGNSNGKNKEQGIVIVNLCLIMDSENRPLLWTVESRTLQPTSRAKDTVLSLPNPIDILSQV